MLYTRGVNTPNTLESLEPCSKQYSLKADLKLNTWLAVATVVALVSQYLLRLNPFWSSPLRAAVALAPVAPGLLYVRSWFRFVRGLDELQRRIQQEAMLFAAVGTVVIGAVINVLDTNGIAVPGLRHGLELGGTFYAMGGLWLVGTAIANCRYK